MEQKKRTISDYKGYDYKKQFWEKANRQYENLLEHTLLKKSLQKHNPEIIADIGCGFGRLFDTYSSFGKNWVLLDYAEHLLEQAKHHIPEHKLKHTTISQGSFYDMPFDNDSVDYMFSIRTMHHMEQPEDFFSEAFRVLKPNGTLLVEIPNKRHIKNIVKGTLNSLRKKAPSLASIMNQEALKLGPAFFNYNPTDIQRKLIQTGFTIQKTTNTSFFRSEFLKRFVSPLVLVTLDTMCQSIFFCGNLGPSVYVECKK